ncbi:MAG TPA: gliding motility lipoprotein GldB [Cyclobacteriaceae bacterium]|nr:gliding motility lipoprotein GldB [Cyclobacteriaceae bacterium]
MRMVFRFIFCCLVAAACTDKTEEKCVFTPDTQSIKINLTFESLEDSLPAITSKSQLVGFLDRHRVVRDVFFSRSAYQNDSVFINELYSRFSNPYLDTLLMETHRIYGGGSELKKEFENAYANLKYYYPDMAIPKIQTVVTGMESDLFVSDSLVIIGLDYFLGDGSRFRPNNMYQYMLRRYNKNFIVPSVFLLTGIEGHINPTDPADKTVLADMVTYGKAFYFAKSMLPCTPDSVLIGYTAPEIEGSREYESLIWSRLVEDEVLFATSHLIKQKYIAERPKTIEVGEQCPGRIGTWVGWQIVKHYMETHSTISLPQLMQMKDAQRLFKESGYKPQVVKVPGKEKM